MKKILTVVLIVGLLPCYVSAANKSAMPWDKCEQTGTVALDAHGYILQCVDGVLQDLSKAPYVDIDITITKDEVVIHRATVMSQDRRSVPCGVTNEIPYNSSANIKADKTTLTFSYLKTGVSMTITPMVVSKDRIMLDIDSSIVELVNMDEIPVGDAVLELPHTKGTSFRQRMILSRDKQTTFTNDGYAVTVSAKII